MAVLRNQTGTHQTSPDGVVAEDQSSAPRQAVTLLECGDARLALKAASDACYAEPESAQARYDYGQAWLALGQASRAEQAYCKTTRRIFRQEQLEADPCRI